MFSQNKITRILGMIIAACPFGIGRASAQTYVLAENECVKYNDNNSTADCTLYSFDSCASNCISTPDFYQITGSTDARDFQGNCINASDKGNGSYYDEFGSSFNGQDSAGYYTMNVSGCLQEHPLSTGRYGTDSCGFGPIEDMCDEKYWREFRSCIGNLGCLLADQYTGWDSCSNSLNQERCEGFFTGIICAETFDPNCTPYDQRMGLCVATPNITRQPEDVYFQLQETCGYIETAIGKMADIVSLEAVHSCYTGYVL